MYFVHRYANVIAPNPGVQTFPLTRALCNADANNDDNDALAQMQIQDANLTRYAVNRCCEMSVVEMAVIE